MVTDSPSGVHIFTREPKSKIVKALKDLAAKDKKYAVGRIKKKNKILLDPYQPNTGIPGSLAIKGRPYRPWKKP